MSKIYSGRVNPDGHSASFEDASLREGEIAAFNVRFEPLRAPSANLTVGHHCPNCGQRDDGYCRECDY